ncbi:hypothetical protein CSPAE12_08331 [Colletotrichum incanum]|nr:hypothetical protein CSPAE12_08331 [Colletotrichum incanum]
MTLTANVGKAQTLFPPHHPQASTWPDTRILFGSAISTPSYGDSYLKPSFLNHPTQPCQPPKSRFHCLLLPCSSPSKNPPCFLRPIPLCHPPGLPLCDATCLACEHEGLTPDLQPGGDQCANRKDPRLFASRLPATTSACPSMHVLPFLRCHAHQQILVPWEEAASAT